MKCCVFTFLPWNNISKLFCSSKLSSFPMYLFLFLFQTLETNRPKDSPKMEGFQTKIHRNGRITKDSPKDSESIPANLGSKWTDFFGPFQGLPPRNLLGQTQVSLCLWIVSCWKVVQYWRGRVWFSTTLQGINISPWKANLKMLFLFLRWDMLVSWRVSFQFCKKNRMESLDLAFREAFLFRISFLDQYLCSI